MKSILFVLSLLSLTTVSQPVVSKNALLVKPGFVLGDKKIYKVTEEIKTDDFVGGPKAENEFKIQLEVLDTVKGYIISYKVETVKTTNKGLSVASMIANITNGIEFVYKLPSDGFMPVLLNSPELHVRLLKTVDSLARYKNFNRQEHIMLHFLKKTLLNPQGIEICLTPFLIFNNCFNQPLFRDHKDWRPGYTYNLFNDPVIAGVGITELKKINLHEDLAELSFDFKGNRDSAAKYQGPVFQELYAGLKGQPFNKAYLPTDMRNDFERNITIYISTGWPKKIHDKKVEFYVQKIIKKTTIQMLVE